MIKHNGVKYKIKKHFDSKGNKYYIVQYYTVKYIIKHKRTHGVLRELVKIKGWFYVMPNYIMAKSPRKFKSKKSVKKFIKK